MSASPIKASTPEKVLFTEKEDRVLKAAWHCLKSPPEIDIEKLKVAADFNTTKTASNTWGTIKKKLASLAPPVVVEGDAGDETAATAATPKPKVKGKGTPASKKRSKKAVAADGDGDNEAETPAKKRKTGKKIVVAAADEEEEEEEVVKEEPVGEEA